MKKYIVLIISIFAVYTTYAQTPLDALRYSQNQYGGTARSVAMGSSFSALGADLSTLATNPAGIALYRGGEFSFTPAILNDQVKSSFNGSSNSDFKYGFLFNNLGFAVTFDDNNSTSGWKGVSFGISYNRLQNYNQNIVIEGVNNVGSMIDLFAYNANAQDPSGAYDPLNDFYEAGAYETFLIDYADGEYWSPVKDNGVYGQTQRKFINRKGGLGEYDFTFGANYEDKLYIGGTMGIQSLHYKENTVYKESNIPFSSDTVYVTNPESSSSYIIESPDFFTLNEDLITSGTGINLKLGIIYRPIDWLRVGAAFHTPTFFSLTDRYKTEFYAKYLNKLPTGEYDREWPPIENREYSSFSYELVTPSRFIGSLGVIIRKVALLSVEYEYVNYTRAKFSAYEDDFSSTNQDIQNSFIAASNIRAGGELKLGPASLRAGFGYYANPYSSELNRLNASQIVVSGGVGLTSGSFYVDFAYNQSMYEDNYFLYNGYVNEPVPALSLKRGTGMVTFGVKF